MTLCSLSIITLTLLFPIGYHRMINFTNNAFLVLIRRYSGFLQNR